MADSTTTDHFPKTAVLKRFYADLIPGYLAQRYKDLSSFETMLEEGNFEGIRKLAHKLKGSGATYGFAALSQYGEHMQSAGRNKNADQIRENLKSLRKYLETVQVTYKD